MISNRQLKVVSQIPLHLQVRLVLIRVVETLVECGDAWGNLKAATIKLRNIGEGRRTRSGAGYQIAEEPMPIDLRSVIEGA